MPDPISIPIPSVDAYQPTQFHGLNTGDSYQAAQQGAAPLTATVEKDKAENDKYTQAAQFNQLLRSGADGMQAYIADAAKVNPELAQQFTQEYQGVQPYLKTLKGKDLVDTSLNLYDSWNNRLNGLKVGKALQDNPNDINPALAVSGLGAKEMISARSTATRNDALNLASKAAAGKSDAMAAYYKQLPQMKQSLVEMVNRSRERAAHLRSAGSGNMQFKLKTAQEDLTSTEKDINALTDELTKANSALSQSDPMIAQMNGTAQHVRDLNQQMRYLRNEKDKYQGWINSSVQKGADPGDWQNTADNENDVTTPPELRTKRQPQGARKLPPSDAPDSVLQFTIEQANPKLQGKVTPDMIKGLRESLQKDENAGSR